MVNPHPEAAHLGALDSHWGLEKEGRKVDLACGSNLRPGFSGVDSVSLQKLVDSTPAWEGQAPEHYSDYQAADLMEFPWPFEDNSISVAYSSHFVEHIPHQIPGTDPKVDGWFHWFGELYRVMEDGGIVEIIHPFSRSDRAFWDPTHTRFIHYQTWFYLQKDQREELGVNHYAPNINFEILNIQTIHEPTLLEGRSQEVVEFARQFYFNPTDDLFVVMQVNK